jgi:hypothetical protein
MVWRADLRLTRRVRASTVSLTSVSSVPYWPALVSKNGLRASTLA